MARKRMISPEIWESQDFSQLSDLAKIVFISLFSHADDEGRGRADPTFIKNITFPYDEGRRVADIKQALSEIALRMSVQLYSVNGIEYYVMKSWERWQKVEKPSKSKFPAPPYVGVGGDMPNCEKFGEDSPTVPRPFPESSPTNRRRIEEKGIESNIVVDEDISKMLKGVVFDCKPIYPRGEYKKAADALKRSAWARANLTHLSKIHRNWDKLVSGFYNDRDDNPNNRIVTDESANELNRIFANINAEDL